MPFAAAGLPLLHSRILPNPQSAPRSLCLCGASWLARSFARVPRSVLSLTSECRWPLSGCRGIVGVDGRSREPGQWFRLRSGRFLLQTEPFCLQTESFCLQSPSLCLQSGALRSRTGAPRLQTERSSSRSPSFRSRMETAEWRPGRPRMPIAVRKSRFRTGKPLFASPVPADRVRCE